MLQRPVLCSGLLDREHCEAPARAVLVQLRPDASGRPSIVVVGSCMTHLRPMRTFLASTWPEDEVMSVSIDMADVALSALVDQFSSDGSFRVLSEAGVA